MWIASCAPIQGISPFPDPLQTLDHLVVQQIRVFEEQGVWLIRSLSSQEEERASICGQGDVRDRYPCDLLTASLESVDQRQKLRWVLGFCHFPQVFHSLYEPLVAVPFALLAYDGGDSAAWQVRVVATVGIPATNCFRPMTQSACHGRSPRDGPTAPDGDTKQWGRGRR